MANAIMCCKYWLGFDKLCQPDISSKYEVIEEGCEGEDDTKEDRGE